MSTKSLRNTLAFRSDYDFRTFLKLLHYCSIYLNRFIKTCEYFILTIKENCQKGTTVENLEKTALIELCSFFIDILAFELVKLYPGVGILLHFFRPGGRSFALKICPRSGDFDGKS